MDLCSSERVRPLIAALILALCSSENFLPLAQDDLPFIEFDNFIFASSVIFFPLFPTLIFSLCSSERVLPLIAALIFSLNSSDLFLPLLAKLILAFVSSDMTRPFSEPPLKFLFPLFSFTKRLDLAALK
uniref:Uncharacterized protein n=1 Tax=Rhizobium phage IG49 TaxID=3129228 RepID=A0AAU8HZ65_9CAUD